MKYHIQPNTDGTYTVLETSDQEFGMLYIVDRTVVEQMYNLAQVEQMQLVMYDAEGHVEYTFLKRRHRLFQRNISMIFAFLTLFICAEAVSVGGSMVWESALIFGLLYLQYHRMIILKKSLYDQKRTISSQGMRIRLRQKTLETAKQFKKAMVAEATSLFVMCATLAVAIHLNEGKALAASGRRYRMHQDTIYRPLYDIANGWAWKILLGIFVIATALYFCSIIFLRCRGYAEREFVNQYYTLKARLGHGTFSGWEYDEKLTRAEGYIMQWSKGRNRPHNMEENMEKVRSFYERHKE